VAGPSLERAFPAPVLQGRGSLIASPFQFFMGGEDHLRVACVNSVFGNRLVITGRFLQEGRATPQDFSYDFVPTSDRIDSTQLLPMGTGALLNVVVRTAGSIIERGQCFVRVDVVRGLTGATIVLGTLLAGYIGSWGGRAWPGTVLESPTEGPGYVVLQLSTAPAAGGNPSIGLPEQTRWRIIGATAVLTTSAAVATRNAILVAMQSSTNVFFSESSFAQGAGQTRQHTWGAGVTNPLLGAGVTGMGALPVPLMLSTRAALDAQIAISTNNIDAGDQWTTLKLLVEEWLNPVTLFP
jgi:hypothetical protein